MAIVGIAMLVFGFNYLKGKNLFKKDVFIYAKYQDVQGLGKSNPVVINGLQIGRIENLDGGKDMRQIVVTISLTKEVNIPDNSLAVINPSLLGGNSTLQIQLGNSDHYLKSGDTVLTSLNGGALDQALKVINPVLYEVKNVIKSLDSVLYLASGVFDPTTKNNVRGIVANLNTTTASFAISAASMQKMLDSQNGSVANALQNVKTFTSNLNANNGKLDSIMSNANVASAKLASLNLKTTLDTLNAVLDNFKKVSEKLNSKDGSLGLLLTDKQLYQNLTATSNKLNILLDDFRVHPKRYISISVFGKKEKGGYLAAPLVDDTLKVAK